MFIPAPGRARVDLAVVAYGVNERLTDCLASLVQHESSIGFTVTCVLNPESPEELPPPALPDGIRVVRPASNLGWAGGLHAAREGLDAEYLVWIQDDMVVLPGWLDALVAAADTHPDVAAFGSVGVDERGVPDAIAAGSAEPLDRIDEWNATDTTREHLPEAVTRYDWVTSKGMLARVSAWDEVGGTDPRLFPLNHVDKDYCSHLRCHGWGVALVPGARLHHAGSRSAPGELRQFLPGWQADRLNQRWAAPLGQLASGARPPVPHECASWRTLQDVELLAGREASIMLVPFSRVMSGRVRDSDAETRRILAEREALISTLSWRITTPLRAVRRWFGGQ